MRHLIFITILLLSVLFSTTSAQIRTSGTFCWPQNWWIGMGNNRVMLLLYGTEMSLNTATVSYPGISVIRQFPGQNNSYLFVEIEISDHTSIGSVPIILTRGEKKMPSPVLSLRNKRQPANIPILKGSDAIYEIVPDRFVNGSPENDNTTGFFERTDRLNPSGTHGGDLKGITNSLDYISKLGITTISLAPLYESNQLVLSYEKFSPTNHYNIDPRLGTVNELNELVTACHERGMKVIITQVLHKIGNQHIIAQKPPFFEWFYERSSIQKADNNSVVFADPYASKEDINRYTKIWEAFDTPVLNQQLEEVRRYLIQNVIWWIETSGVDGVRIDKTHLNSPALLSKLSETIQKEYPGLNLIASPETDMVEHNEYWKNGKDKDPVFTHVTDMPLNSQIVDAFAEYKKTNEALIGIYKTLACDMIYEDPSNQLIFTGDAHDLTRMFTLADKDPAIFRMYSGFLLTARGIPSFLYGTEIQMEGLALEGFGFVRGDFPGGWANDQKSAFIETSLSVNQRDGLKFITTLLEYRKNNPEIMEGKTIHYKPHDDIYAFIRCSDKKKLLVIINNNPDSPRRLESNSFSASLGEVYQVENVISGEISSGLGNIILNPKSILILEISNKAE